MAEPNFKEMELWEHLAELRTRLIRSLIYIGVGAIAIWVCYRPLWDFLWAPLRPILAAHGVFGDHIVWQNIWDPFIVRLQISLVGGLTLAVPCITYEIWGFIAPGLTRSERKGFYFVGPLAVFFFVSGLAVAYLVLPATFGYFAQFLGSDHLMPSPVPYVMFLVKMCLAFGLVFELPVVLMFFAWIGLVTSKMLRAGWRHAMVGCAALAAVATPSNDAATMLMMAVPLALLYFLSIGLVRIVERLRRSTHATWAVFCFVSLELMRLAGRGRTAGAATV
jgi:sec-independent protein translocase protein TatC